MANTKVTGLTADTTPTGTDLVMTVDDVAGTPTNKKVTLDNLAGSAPFSGVYVPQTVVGPELIRQTTAHAADDEFLSGSLAGAWTTVHYGNSSALTITPGDGMLSIRHAGGDNAQGFHALLKSMTGLSAPVSIETCVRLDVYQGSMMVGLVFTDGTTAGSGNQVACDYMDLSGGGKHSLRRWTGFNAYAADLAGSPSVDIGRRYQNIFLRLTWVSANTWRGEVSPDGVSWLPFNYTSNQADGSYTMTPTHMGIWCSTYGSGANLGGIFTFDHFRVTA